MAVWLGGNRAGGVTHRVLRLPTAKRPGDVVVASRRGGRGGDRFLQLMKRAPRAVEVAVHDRIVGDSGGTNDSGITSMFSARCVR